MTTTYEIEQIADTMPAAYDWAPEADSLGIEFDDFFCGAGGSSIGLTKAGFTLNWAVNHWKQAIATHSYNFARAEHLCQDLQGYDIRRKPRGARVLWASPICTEMSPAGGKKKRRKDAAQAELELFGKVDKEANERTRVTFWEVIRFTEMYRYDAVLIENVPEAADWELFDVWLLAMKTLGYNAQFVSVTSAHIGVTPDDQAAQWRDRLYVIFTRLGIPLPNVEPRPIAFCEHCDEDVRAVQSWKKPGRKIGSYRRQYVYVCPNQRCRHATVEPYVVPAAEIIDWSDLGIRVGDRPRPLAEKTRARIQAGIDKFWGPITLEATGNTFERRPGVRTWSATGSPLTALTTDATKGVATPPFLVNTNHNDLRLQIPTEGPLPSRTTKIGEGMVVTPFVAELRGGNSVARSTLDPLATVTASGNHHGLTTPPDGAFVMTNNGGYAKPHQLVKPVSHPLSAVTARDTTSLVIPFRRGARPYPAGDGPLSTIATREQHGLARIEYDIDDCLFRMLSDDEHLLAQRFPITYRVLGNKGARTKQAGNAVSANVARWIGSCVAPVLCGVAA